MTIHHSTIERAKKLGVALTERTEDGVTVYTAWYARRNQKIEGENCKLLVDEAEAMIKIVDSPIYQWRIEPGDEAQRTVFVPIPEVGAVSEWEVSCTDDYLHRAFEKAQERWKEVVYLASEEEVDLEELVTAGTPDKQATGSVVAPHYRAKYSEAGHPTHCGDELAEILIRYTTNSAGINMELFERIASDNGVDLSKYDRNAHGWQGRLRMTGRNMMARRIVLFQEGVLNLPDGPHKMSAEWLNDPARLKYKQGRKKTKGGTQADVAAMVERMAEKIEPTVVTHHDNGVVQEERGSPATPFIPAEEVTDRFGVNPAGVAPIEPKKGRRSNRKVA